MAKVNFKSKYIFLTIILLALVVAVLAWFNKPNQNLAAGTISVIQNGEIVKTLTLADLKALPAVSVKKTIQSSKEPDDSGIFTGARLIDLLNSVDKENLLNDLNQINVKATDGFTVSFAPDELQNKNNILVIYAKNGEALKPKKAGGAGPFRILAVDDTYGNRCVKYVNVIEVK